MSENAGTDPRVTAAEDAAEPEEGEALDATQAAEDPTASTDGEAETYN